MNEEQDVVAAKQGGVDGGEVTGQGGLRVQDLRPRDVGSFRCGFDAVGLEDLPHGRRSDPITEAGQFAMNATVAPGRILGGEAKDESLDVCRCRWASRSSRGLCPVTGDAATVPLVLGVGCDDPSGSSLVGERGGDRAEHGAVSVVDGGSVDLTAEDGEFVAERCVSPDQRPRPNIRPPQPFGDARRLNLVGYWKLAWLGVHVRGVPAQCGELRADT